LIFRHFSWNSRVDVIPTSWFTSLVATIIGQHNNGTQCTLKTFGDTNLKFSKNIKNILSKFFLKIFEKNFLFQILFVSKYWILKLSLTKSRNSYWNIVIKHPIRIVLQGTPTQVLVLLWSSRLIFTTFYLETSYWRHYNVSIIGHHDYIQETRLHYRHLEIKK